MFELSDVLQGTNGRLVGGAASATFERVAIDSRHVTTGDLFAAFRGERQDGHRFVRQALDRGAGGALVDRLPTGQALRDLAHYWRKKHHLTAIGITGSVGKTSTKELIGDILAQRFSVLRTPANLNTEIGVPLALMQLDATHEVAALEMAMTDIGDIRALARLAEPQIGVVTNVQPSHLERLGTIERIAEAKSELVQELPATGVALLNADDERVRAMASATTARVVTYGLSNDADIVASEVESRGLQGFTFLVRYQDQQLAAEAALPGAHFGHAALAAIAVAKELGFTLREAVGALKGVERGGRVQVVDGVHGATILDDCYNANPASMLAALELLKQTEGRHVAVLGDMLELGSFEVEGHRLVGKSAAKVADWMITVGERARLIADEARGSGLDGKIESLDSTADAVERLRAGLRRGDFVLVKGSHSMHLEEVVNAIRAVA